MKNDNFVAPDGFFYSGSFVLLPVAQHRAHAPGTRVESHPLPSIPVNPITTSAVPIYCKPSEAIRSGISPRAFSAMKESIRLAPLPYPIPQHRPESLPGSISPSAPVTRYTSSTTAKRGSRSPI